MTHDDIPDLLIAEVADQWIAFPARRIERVLPTIPPFGEFPSFATPRAGSALLRRILGLANLDGRVLTLVDPAALLGKGARIASDARKDPKKTLVVDSGPYQFGLVVDAVIGIRTGRKDEGAFEESESSPDGAKGDPGPARSQASVFTDIRIDSKRARLIDIDILCSSMPREAA